MHDTIVVLDFGGQYAHLIANRVRRLGVYSEILEPETDPKKLKKYKGIILSGGPQSVYSKEGPSCNPAVFDLGIPVLGICYGHQLMQHILGGDVIPGETREYGIAMLTLKKPAGLFKEVKKASRVWMSHWDTVRTPAPGFEEAATTKDCENSALANEAKHLYGLQFHPEVTHTEEGMKILDNFIGICEVKRDWNIGKFLKEEIEAIKEKIGGKRVFLLVSGGVDSAVAFALLEKALGKGRVYGLLVDTGLMRLNEARTVKKSLAKAGFNNLHVVNRGAQFFEALKGVTDPEKKRNIIGELFWNVKEDVAEELNLNSDEWIMGQGTIYPDTIETGGTKHADVIKTHHNRVDLMQELIKAGKVIEPLAQLYKDEGRALGEKLGLPHDIVWRQPFPGPGLGVRILCVSPEEAKKPLIFDELSKTIQIFVRETLGLKGAQTRVLPIRSVGVQGDFRTYKHPLALFTDCRDWNKLEQVSTAITNRFGDVNRVILALVGESGDFVLKASYINADRVRLLQKADNAVSQIMTKAPSDYSIWQFPVVLAPTSTQAGHESIVLRPIVSIEAMTASFAQVDWDVLNAITKKVLGEKGVTHVFFDLTHKPPGTIEWE